MPTPNRLHQGLLICFSFGMFALFLYTVCSRLFYPYDLEWMEGGVLLHGHRVLNGKELYPYPSEDYIPFIYPPLYYWMLAGVAWFSKLDYPAGRILSILGAMASCAAIIRALRLEGVSWFLAICGGAFFLSTFEDSGAFLDIVRSDGVLLAFMTWSMVWVREGKLRLGGLVLMLAFATKHNAAIMGFPLALWLWRKKGWRDALQFGLWSAVPALLFLSIMQWNTEGRFLTYLLEVPAHHPFVLWRLTWLASYEILSAHILFAFMGLLALSLWFFRHGHTTLRWAGILGATSITMMLLLAIPMQSMFSEWIQVSGLSKKMIGRNAMGVVFCVSLLFIVVSIWKSKRKEISSGYSFWLTCGGVAWVFSGIMRAHHGGYSNVLLPGLWASALLCGIILHELWTRIPVYRWGWVLLVGVQLWMGSWNPSNLIPSQQDVLAGDRLIARLRTIDGSVFSPHAPWYPVIAGKSPSAHLIALWDIKHKGGPFYQSVQIIEDAIAKKQFAVIMLANKKEDYGRKKHYRHREVITYPSKKVFYPKKGWSVRPTYLYFPHDDQ